MASIKRYFMDKDIFITGGTGFMGKVLIEKLLRSCGELNNIFVLIRSKRGKHCQERLDDIISLPLFDLLRQNNPSALNKIVAINGDMRAMDLGISKPDFELIKNVSIVYHTAATVRFDEPLQEAIIMNTRGTHEVIKLSEQLSKLEVLVHISTSYCYPTRHTVEEQLYPPYADWKTSIQLAERYDKETLNILCLKNSAITADCMFLITLRFYASGGFLLTAGDLMGVSKTSVCRIIKVSHHIALLRRLYIKFPETESERSKVVQDFYNIARFPRVLAAMDCSHVRIQSPGAANGELFRNRKGYFSINVQTLCDPSLKIMDIVARWPGASHDSTIFNNSQIRARFERGEFGNNVIVADGGYQCRTYVMTPLRQCYSDAEALYNESQIRTRNCVERSYGVWKGRFPILATGLRLKLQTIQSIIVATAILHNVCCMNKEQIPPRLDDNMEAQINLMNTTGSLPIAHDDNHSSRQVLIYEYFNNLLSENI